MRRIGQRRRGIDADDRPLKRERPVPKPWREELKDTPDPESLGYRDAFARLITLRHTYDDQGQPLVVPEQFDEIVRRAIDQRTPLTENLETIRAAIYIALSKLEPELEEVEF